MSEATPAKTPHSFAMTIVYDHIRCAELQWRPNGTIEDAVRRMPGKRAGADVSMVARRTNTSTTFRPFDGKLTAGTTAHHRPPLL